MGGFVSGGPPRIKEQALLLGPRKALVGVLAQAPDPASASTRPTVVLLNAGIIHRVGPNRLHVQLARELAGQGYDVLRFDLSGIGDSAPRSDTLAPLDAVLADMREVIDWLESARNVRRVVLVGLCSGADHALVYAANDPRVVALGLLDPSIPRTKGFFMRHWGRRLVSARTWLNVLSGRHVVVRQALRRVPRQDDAQAAQPTLESPQVRAALEEAYRKALGHGARILAVFAGASGREYRMNYREQMLDAFPGVHFGDRLRLEYFKDADHTFSAEGDRSALSGVIAEWLASLDREKVSMRSLATGLVAIGVAVASQDW